MHTPSAEHARPFSIDIRVYWEDTDAGGVVFYANYLKFFERARTEWLRQLGVEQSSLQAQSGAIFVVADISLRYLAPARLDDVLTITAEVTALGAASLEMRQQAWRRGALLTEGTVRVGCVAASTLAPERIPTSVRNAMRAVMRSDIAPH